MQKLCVLVWRPTARAALFFRGDMRYEIYLPYISDELVVKSDVAGWVQDEMYARIFPVPVVLDPRKSFAKDFIMDRFEIYPYTGPVISTQLFRPIKRPPNRTEFLK